MQGWRVTMEDHLFEKTSLRIGSMYGIFTYMNGWIFMVNVGKHTIHGCYGVFQTPPEVRCFLGCPNASSQGVWKPVGDFKTTSS